MWMERLTWVEDYASIGGESELSEIDRTKRSVRSPGNLRDSFRSRFDPKMVEALICMKD